MAKLEWPFAPVKRNSKCDICGRSDKELNEIKRDRDKTGRIAIMVEWPGISIGNKKYINICEYCWTIFKKFVTSLLLEKSEKNEVNSWNEHTMKERGYLTKEEYEWLHPTGTESKPPNSSRIKRILGR